MNQTRKALEDIAYMRDVMEKSKGTHEALAPPPLKGLSLYALEQGLYEAHERISEALERGEEIPAEALAVVDSYALAAADKRDACAAVLRRLDAEVDYAKAERDRLDALIKARENAAARLRGLILTTMQAHNIQKIKGNTTTFTVQQNPPSVDVDENMPLPMEFQRVVPATVQPDKVKIREALKAGREVPGARLVPGSYRLVIR